MKKVISLFLVGIMLFSAAQAAYAADDPGLSDNPKLVHIKDIYAKGVMFKDRGDAESHRKRWGLAQKHYEHAEDYFLDCIFRYRELGEKFNIDTSNDVWICDKMQRKMHVEVNRMRRKARRR